MEDLKDWAMTYFKNRDIMLRKIEKIEEKADGFLIVNNDGTSNNVKVHPVMKDVDVIINSFKDTTGTLVLLNSRENIDFLIHNWEKFIELKGLTLIFSNPDSLQDKKWIVTPYIHNKITEPKSLRAGLISLFTTVDVVLRKN